MVSHMPFAVEMTGEVHTSLMLGEGGKVTSFIVIGYFP